MPFLPAVLAGRSSEWIEGRTPPSEMVMPESSLLSSSSLRIASCRWRGLIRDSAARHERQQAASTKTGVGPTLVVPCGVTGQLEDLGAQVLEDSSEVDGGATTDAAGIVALLKETVDTTDGERETGLGGTRGRLGSGAVGGTSLATRAWGRGRVRRGRTAGPSRLTPCQTL